MYGYQEFLTIPGRSHLQWQSSVGGQNGRRGVHPRFGWEQSGGESVPAVAGMVYRLLARRSAGARPGRTVESVSWGGCEGRNKASTYGDLMGLAGRGLARHLRLGSRYEYRHQVDEACCRRGGVAGAEPPHKGGPKGRRPDRPEMQWSVVSDGAAPGSVLTEFWPWSICSLRYTRVRTHFGMHLPGWSVSARLAGG